MKQSYSSRHQLDLEEVRLCLNCDLVFIQVSPFCCPDCGSVKTESMRLSTESQDVGLYPVE